MTQIDDGGPAKDKTLLDWFAGMAPPMLDQWLADSRDECPTKHWATDDSEWRYFWAGEMIAAKRRCTDAEKSSGEDTEDRTA